MKKVILPTLAFLLTSITASAQIKSDTIEVNGVCGMCKKRIEKAAKVEGVQTAVWDLETKKLAVTYETSVTSNDAIQKNVAAAGHDTEKITADTKVYQKLPGCCLYERKAASKPTTQEHKH